MVAPAASLAISNVSVQLEAPVVAGPFIQLGDVESAIHVPVTPDDNRPVVTVARIQKLPPIPVVVGVYQFGGPPPDSVGEPP